MQTIYEDIQFNDHNDCIIVISDDIAIMEIPCEVSNAQFAAILVAAVLFSVIILVIATSM